jgi:glycosyltransferase involved in cell wall biosynthesis
MKYTLAITTYNRPEMTMKSFKGVIDDERINEIVIVDDHSDWATFLRLRDLCSDLLKVTTIRNGKNLGCYHNKKNAVNEASNEWVILLDSDNIIKPNYLDALDSLELSFDTIYAPEFARPHFDYRAFGGVTMTKNNVKNYVDVAKFDCLINTCNYVVNRFEYLRRWKDHKEPWTADTLFMNYNWLEAGNKIHVVKGMSYNHLVHDGSHYKEHVNKTGNMADELLNKLRKL